MKQYNYNQFAKYYDILDGYTVPYKNIAKILNKIIKPYGKRVLDMACGTGGFTVELKRLGYKIEGADLSNGMLEVAKKKNKQIHFFRKDMRSKLNKKYDSIICMFNAIAHLTKEELIKTLKNFRNNTSLIVFDIFNFDFMNKNWIKGKFIDLVREVNGIKAVRFNNNKLDRKNKIMNINQTTYIQEGFNLEKYNGHWQMKIYNLYDIKNILKQSGFKIKFLFGGFDKKIGLKKWKRDSISMVVVAEKIN